jgi:hypothetical protein
MEVKTTTNKRRWVPPEDNRPFKRRRRAPAITCITLVMEATRFNQGVSGIIADYYDFFNPLLRAIRTEFLLATHGILFALRSYCPRIDGIMTMKSIRNKVQAEEPANRTPRDWFILDQARGSHTSDTEHDKLEHQQRCRVWKSDIQFDVGQNIWVEYIARARMYRNKLDNNRPNWVIKSLF